MAIKGKRNSFLGKLILFFNIISVFALLFIYLSAWVSPQIFWPLAFPGLIYPFVLIINIGFIIIWILRRKFYFLISLVVVLAGYSHVTSFISYKRAKKQLPETGVNLHILSYNVRVFDLYNYGPRWQLNFTERNNIFRFLKEQDFDIICFQEFVHDKTGAFKTFDTIPRFLQARYSHAGYTRESRGLNYFGLATFSSYPIVNRGVIKFPTRAGNLCIYSDIEIGNDTLRVYNVHFESIGLSPEDYLFVENMINVEQITDRQILREGGLQILRRLKNAFQQRAIQVELVAESVANSPYPVILAGDFNDTPTSYAYRIMTRSLNDAFKSGKGIGQTYIGVLPGFRIDYILHSDHFVSFNFVTGKQKYSDHYPISVWLNLDPGSNQK
jgi:endonuclease/exonuclease/phosphatase family metal-dependent hydrolase